MKFKKIAFWGFYENFAKENFIFLKKCTWNNNLFYKFKKLYHLLLKKKYKIIPLNKANLNQIKYIIFCDIPKNADSLLLKLSKFNHIKKILIIEECEDLRPENWNIKYHKIFDIVFTCSNDLIRSGKNYKKIYLTNLNKKINYYKNIKYNNNSIILLNSNKKLNSRNELYSLRRNIIDYVIQKKIKNFKLYGHDWDRMTFNMNSWYSFLNSSKFNLLFKYKKYRSISSGSVKDKNKIMSQFDFSICFENIKNTKDYFTEKITDSMICGVIPVYYGCPNIDDYFPTNTFIDFRNFDSIENLFDCLLTMPEKKIFTYKKNIRSFLLSKKSYIYTGDYFAKVIKDEILLKKD